ncbi:oligosaccharide flippase family protein [Candidatus Microgenomates bacterium]|nr:oligosaccharide flippase family protein [Candidatus Microgenomates bacterium]
MKESYRQSLVLVSGTVINSLLGLGFYVLVARALPVDAFGYFSALLGVGLVAAELADLGINTAIVKFGSGKSFPTIFSFAVVERGLTCLLLAAVFFAAAKAVDPLLLYSGATAVSLLLFYLATQSLIARQKYGWQVGVSIAGNLGRLALVVFLVSAQTLTFVSALVAFCLGAGLTFVAGVGLLFTQFRWGLWNRRGWYQTTREVFRFALPTAASFSLASLAGKIDAPLVFTLSGPVAAGLYSSAQKLVSVVVQVAAALDGVFAPKFSAKVNFLRAFREYLILTTVFGLAILAAIPLAQFFIPLVFGTRYLSAVTVFQILLVGSVFLLLSGPFAAAILYKHGRPLISLGINAVIFVITIGLFLLLVPTFGPIGAALAAVVGNFIGLGLSVIKWRQL